VGFSKRIERGVFTGQTVVFAAVQVAYWLGFQRVFILGMDLGGTGTLARFYESGSAVASSRLDKDFKPYIIPAFELARRLFEAEGREIYNVSPNSRLPTTIIPKLSFDEALVLSNN
jgi:Kdo-III transferase WaaZ